MTLEDNKKHFGEEYPAAIVRDGIRMPLVHESRFSRSYSADERKLTIGQSRFADASASITAEQLRREWPMWTNELQMDFCQQCRSLSGQSDLPEMLRFIMQQGSQQHWCGIALSVAYGLSRDEAFALLVRALEAMKDVDCAANITQGMAVTQHPDAKAALRRHLANVWAKPALWDDAEFKNWVAFDATSCIARLIELGESPADFSGQAQQLAGHVCVGNRETWHRYLAKHYPETSFPI